MNEDLKKINGIRVALLEPQGTREPGNQGTREPGKQGTRDPGKCLVFQRIFSILKEFFFQPIFFRKKKSHQSPLMGGEKNLVPKVAKFKEKQFFSAEKLFFGRFFFQKFFFTPIPLDGGWKKTFGPKNSSSKKNVFSEFFFHAHPANMVPRWANMGPNWSQHSCSKNLPKPPHNRR